MTKDELFKIVEHHAIGTKGSDAIMAAVDLYTAASNDAKPIVSVSVTYTRFDMERSYLAGANNIDFEDWFQEHYPYSKRFKTLGKLIDSLDNLAHALKMPLPPQMHLEQIGILLPEKVKELKEIFVEITGENPWD